MRNLRLIQVFIFFPITCASVALLSGLSIVVFANVIAILIALNIILIIIERYVICQNPRIEMPPMPNTIALDRIGKIISKLIILAFSIIVAIKSLLFYAQVGPFTRSSWLHHYSEHYIFFIPILLWPLLICLFFQNYHHSKISFFDILLLASVCAIMVLDGTRISFLFFAMSWLVFRKKSITTTEIIFAAALFVGAILVVSFFRLSEPPADLLAGLYENIFHSFAGGFFLYAEHNVEVIRLPSMQYDRPWAIRSVPGLDIFISTVLDQWAGTDWSLTHFASIFWQMNDFRFVESLGVPMNSYYTALLLNHLFGVGFSLLLIIPILYSAAQSSGFFSKLSTFWICAFLLTFSMYFININIGFALVFFVSFCHGLIVLALHICGSARRLLAYK